MSKNIITHFLFKKTIFFICFNSCLLFCLSAENYNSILQRNFNINEVNAFDRLIMNPYSKPLDYTGSAVTALTLLTPAVMFAAPVQDYWKFGLEYAETLALSFGVERLFKFCVSRPRPYMYFDNPPVNEIENGDWDDSFFSAHTTWSFAAATFTTFKFCQYFPDSVYKPFIIAGSYSLALTTAILRMASGNHFLTDVICGAAVGSAIGFLIPWINSFWLKPTIKNENKNESNLAVDISPLGFSLTYKF